jgi:hypothetical protein
VDQDEKYEDKPLFLVSSFLLMVAFLPPSKNSKRFLKFQNLGMIATKNNQTTMINHSLDQPQNNNEATMRSSRLTIETNGDLL